MRLALAKDIGVGVGVRAWTQVTAFLVVVVAGRVLERQEFGIYAIATVFITILSTIMYSGIYEYIIRADDFEAVADTCFWINFAIAVIGAAAMAAAAPLVAALVRAPAIAAVMLWLAPSVLLAAWTSWQEALLLRRKTVTDYYIVWFMAETAAAALAVGLLLRGWRVDALIGYRYGQLVFTSLGYLAYMPGRPRLVCRLAQAGTALGFAGKLYGSRLIGILTNYSADLIIGALASPAAAGAYRLASRMVFGVSEIWFQPIKTIAWVRFSSAARGRDGLDQEWLGLMMILSMVAWPALGGVAVLSRELTETVLGDMWLPAAPVVSILAFSKSAELFEVFLDPLLTSSGQAHRLAGIRAISFVVAVGGFLALAHYGPAHAAWAQVITYWLLAVVTVVLGTRLTGIAGRRLLGMLLPGIATTLATMLAAAAAAAVTAQAGWPQAANLACDIAAGAVLWAFMAGVVFRRRTLRTVAQLRHPAAAVVPG